MQRRKSKGLRRAGAAAFLCAAFFCSDDRPAFAFDTSLGTLICSTEGKAAPSETEAPPTGVPPAEPALVVACSYRGEGSGAEAQYAGTLVLQPQALRRSQSYIWVVRGQRSARLAPGDLAQTFASGGTVTPGTVAPLVPKDGDDRGLGLFTLAEPVSRRALPAGKGAREPKSDPVATLSLTLVEAPA